MQSARCSYIICELLFKELVQNSIIVAHNSVFDIICSTMYAASSKLILNKVMTAINYNNKEEDFHSIFIDDF